MPVLRVRDITAALDEHAVLPSQRSRIGLTGLGLKIDAALPFEMTAIESERAGKALLTRERRAILDRQAVAAAPVRERRPAGRLAQIDEGLQALQPMHIARRVAAPVRMANQGAAPQAAERRQGCAKPAATAAASAAGALFPKFERK